MIFQKINYLPMLALMIVVLTVLLIWDYKRYLNWLKDCFNLKAKKTILISKFLFIASVLMMSFALLDLRGEQQQVSSPLSDQKTIILIDASSSMLVEDVQPNRFKRALTVARHFVKNAVGHQISIIVFSDIAKKLIPFTDDIDLLDARLAGLEDERLKGGGSRIASALAETVQALKNETSNGRAGGNILLITDAEENGSEFKIEGGDGVSMAIVGIGTVSGGKIPMRTQRGTFTGYKTFANKEVISRLDEKYLEKIASLFQRSKKWIVLSFSMPTEEVLTFFREGATKSDGFDLTKIRPVFSQYLVAISILLYALSVLLANATSYSVLTITLILILPNIAKSQEQNEKTSSVNIEKLNKNWSLEEKQQLALEFAKDKDFDNADLLYKESEKALTTRSKANWGVTLLAKGDPSGLKILDEALRQNNSKDIELERQIHSNIKKFLSSDGGGGGKDGDEKNNESDEKNKDGDKSENDGKNGEGSKGEKKKDEKPKDQDSKESEDSEDSEESEQKDKQITNMAQREREIDKKRKMMKVPALLKQLMQDDRALQSEYIDTETNDKNNSREKRDW